jgi:iron complex transport system ATP-binding protein
MLSVESLHAGYGKKNILKGANLTLQPGEMMALIGPNGSGKSTLLRVISGVLQPESGSVKIDGKVVHSMNEQERARKIAVVPQARNLPPAFTGKEVVSLGRTPYLNWLGQLSEEDDAIIAEAMGQTDTLGFADSPINELSGGEQQRLLLARALVQQSPLMLLDEPTTFLDLQFQYGLMKHIRDLAHPPSANQSPRAVLIALHDLNMAFQFADRIALLVKGQIIKMGTPQEMLDDVELLSQVYRVPLTLIEDVRNGRAALLTGN